MISLLGIVREVSVTLVVCRRRILDEDVLRMDRRGRKCHIGRFYVAQSMCGVSWRIYLFWRINDEGIKKRAAVDVWYGIDQPNAGTETTTKNNERATDEHDLNHKQIKQDAMVLIVLYQSFY